MPRRLYSVAQRHLNVQKRPPFGVRILRGYGETSTSGSADKGSGSSTEEVILSVRRRWLAVRHARERWLPCDEVVRDRKTIYRQSRSSSLRFINEGYCSYLPS